MSWSFLADHAESIARGAAGVVALLGLAALLLVTFRWGWVERHYRDVVAKVAVAVFRAVAGGAAVLARSHPTVEGGWSDQPWVATIALAIFGYFFWEVAGAVGDSRSRASKEARGTARLEEIEALKKDCGDAVLAATRSEWLLAHLREPINHELQRIRRVIAQTVASRVSVQQVREGLDSDGQIRTILESLSGLFRLDAISAGGNIKQNFRVGLYVEEAGRLEPRDAFDLATKSHTPFASPRTHPERFRLDTEAGPSHAVRCVRQGQTLIVADCEADWGFQYFEDVQPNYLKSMVAYPLQDCRPDGIRIVKAALLIDTNVTGYFREEDREVIESRIHEFALRIELEYAIRAPTT